MKETAWSHVQNKAAICNELLYIKEMRKTNRAMIQTGGGRCATSPFVPPGDNLSSNGNHFTLPQTKSTVGLSFPSFHQQPSQQVRVQIMEEERAERHVHEKMLIDAQMEEIN